MRLCRFGLVSVSRDTRCCDCWAPEGWARSIWFNILVCRGRMHSRFSEPMSPLTRRFGSGSSAKQTWAPGYATPISSGSTIVASTRITYGSPWTTSMEPTSMSFWHSGIRRACMPTLLSR
ncbi:Uncharacterised protein [Mycobacteroides abscessus subsp. abscessus]|nr:Uncharacterised protein [Mycobacteroides abscessus subsp. abscessus]